MHCPDEQVPPHCSLIFSVVVDEQEECWVPGLLQVNIVVLSATAFCEQNGADDESVPQSVFVEHVIGMFVQKEIRVSGLLQVSTVVEIESSQSVFDEQRIQAPSEQEKSHLLSSVCITSTVQNEFVDPGFSHVEFWKFLETAELVQYS